MEPAGQRARPSGPGSGADETAAWFPAGFDAHRGEVLFAAAERADLAAQTFLDWRWDRAGRAQTRASAASLITRLPPLGRPVAVLWHTGFCCSTLLAKALDCPGRNLSLCEPQILVEIANAGRAGLLARAPRGAVPRLAFHLLSRGFAPNERVTLKPAPAANVLLGDSAIREAGPMLFLYSDCRSFLVSIVKLGEQGRKYVRSAFLAILGDGHPQAQWPLPTMLALSDLELAAVLWHMQIAAFLRHWPQLAQGRAASLDCDTFLDRPGETLHRAGQFLSLPLDADHFNSVLEGPLFRRNAKTGEESFDAARRQEVHRSIAQQLGSDLDRVIARSYEICASTPRGAPLPDPLLPSDKRYCP
ncbi:MAG TPA: hypothetical protein VGL35_06065 [Rhizomicrobium sp.]